MLTGSEGPPAGADGPGPLGEGRREPERCEEEGLEERSLVDGDRTRPTPLAGRDEEGLEAPPSADGDRR